MKRIDIVSCAVAVAITFGQGLRAQADPAVEPDSTQASPAQTTPDQITSVAPFRARPITWKQLIPNIAKEQKQIWTFPLRIGQGNNWAPTLAVSALTTGLVVADPVVTPYFRDTTRFHGFNSAVSVNTTAIGVMIVPVSLYFAGVIKKDSYAKETALLAGEAIANAEILTVVMHNMDRRVRPSNLPPGDNYRDTWFKNKVSFIRGSGSFPSGHSMSAFALATVLARRYPHQRWLPYMAYSLAGIASFSRITSLEHFTSDVFFGAALGYSISRFSVLR